METDFRISTHEDMLPEKNLIEALNELDISGFPSTLAQVGKKRFVISVKNLIAAAQTGDERATRSQMQAVLNMFAADLPAQREGLHSRSDAALPLFIVDQLCAAIEVAGLEKIIMFPAFEGVS